MASGLKLMAVFAHPDDESLGAGGTLAKYASEGVETYVVSATRGERGRFGTAKESPGLGIVGQTREGELRAAAQELGAREVQFLDYCDGDLDRADPLEVIGRIVAQVRRVKPQVVITFGPDGAYGHPDHVAISQFTTAAMVVAADGQHQTGLAPHRVSKLYYLAWRQDKWDAYQAALRKLTVKVDSVERQAAPWPDWAVTTAIDTRAFSPVVWRAVCCHQTQMAIYERLSSLPAEHHEALWGTQEYYRVFSLVNGGRKPETDLFAGLR